MDFISKKKKINEGEIPQYYVENSHPAIISSETYELVKEEFRRRKAAGKQTSAINCFASRITCGDCGSFYGRKVWHSNTKYACTIWQCNNKFQKREFCTTPHLKEKIVKKAFVDAFNTIIENKEEIIENYNEIISKITNLTEKKELTEIDKECSAIEAVIEKLVAKNSRSAIDQEDYNKKYTTYATKYNKLQKRKQELNSQIASKKARKNLIKAFLKELQKQNKLLTEFDESLWSTTLNTMIVKSDKEVVFQFKNGTELEWELE